MSYHKEHYLALFTKAKDWAVAHPVVTVAVIATIVAFIAGRML